MRLVLVLALLLCSGVAFAQTPSVTLTWTAPGDDGSVGRAKTYEMRYSRTAVSAPTQSWWDGAFVVPGLPVPSVSGAADSVTVGLGAWGMTYYFVMRACDDGLPGIGGGTTPGPVNCSGWSNVCVITTTAQGMVQDVTPPSLIGTLRKK